MSSQRRPKFLRKAVLLGVGAVTVWFFTQVWINVSTLATRTLPGIAYSVEMLDRATDLELSRQGADPDARHQSAFLEILTLYETTIASEQDRVNVESVRRAFSDYLEAPSRETWLSLRGAIKVLHAFRFQRAQTFANDSKERFTAALAINVAGLVLFGTIFLLVSISVALEQHGDIRPDNF